MKNARTSREAQRRGVAGIALCGNGCRWPRGQCPTHVRKPMYRGEIVALQAAWAVDMDEPDKLALFEDRACMICGMHVCVPGCGDEDDAIGEPAGTPCPLGCGEWLEMGKIHGCKYRARMHEWPTYAAPAPEPVKQEQPRAPFKVGDRVRCVEVGNSMYLRVGKEDTIASVFEEPAGRWLVTLRQTGMGSAYKANRFELADPAPSGETLRSGWRAPNGSETVTINGQPRMLGFRDDAQEYVFGQANGAVWKYGDRWNWVGADGELHGEGTGNLPSRIEAMLAVEGRQAKAAPLKRAGWECMRDGVYERVDDLGAVQQFGDRWYPGKGDGAGNFEVPESWCGRSFTGAVEAMNWADHQLEQGR